MAALRLIAALIALATATAARADGVERWSATIREASLRFGVPEAWIRQVMRAESGGETLLRGRRIVSTAGALGLMQLMPATWREVRAVEGLGFDPFEPRDNILAGTAYLRAMHDRFGYPGMFAAYNAGPARYAEHLAKGRQLPRETRAYVAKVVRGQASDIWLPPTRDRVSTLVLFAVMPRSIPTARLQTERATRRSSLFVAISTGR